MTQHGILSHKLLLPVIKSKALSESTKSVYMNHIERAMQLFPDHTLLQLLKNPVEFTDRLIDYGKRNKLGSHSLDLTMASLMAIWRYNHQFREKNYDVYEEWKNQKRRIYAPIDIKYKQNEPTPEQVKSYVSFDELEQIRDNLPVGSMERLLFAMYTMIPPVRSDYDRTRIYTKSPAEDAGNYIVLKSEPELVLHEYKTNKRYKKISIPIPENLVKEIAENLKVNPREHLFISVRGVPYQNPNTFNRWANKVLKKETGNKFISLTMLRHIYISRRDLNIQNMSGIEQERIANIMGHSIAMQRGYSWHSWKQTS